MRAIVELRLDERFFHYPLDEIQSAIEGLLRAAPRRCPREVEVEILKQRQIRISRFPRPVLPDGSIARVTRSQAAKILEDEQPYLSGPNLELLHDWLLVHQYDGLWRRWPIAQSTMWSFGVVMVPPSFSDDLGLTSRAEDFAVQ